MYINDIIIFMYLIIDSRSISNNYRNLKVEELKPTKVIRNTSNTTENYRHLQPDNYGIYLFWNIISCSLKYIN